MTVVSSIRFSLVVFFRELMSFIVQWHNLGEFEPGIMFFQLQLHAFYYVLECVCVIVE